ncbi:hypothetical protein [Desertivirga arenae]|uniref:hypothetical protein n=1 Tax=Desertivirga arenae TaxID=2810309 RepID=UPI001A974DF4|nr:hypothetical protein [Pedobacter sp. SYSU D00823]
MQRSFAPETFILTNCCLRGCSVYYNYMVGVSQNGHSNGTIRDNQIYENGAEGLTIDIRSHNNCVYNIN